MSSKNFQNRENACISKEIKDFGDFYFRANFGAFCIHMPIISLLLIKRERCLRLKSSVEEIEQEIYRRKLWKAI